MSGTIIPSGTGISTNTSPSISPITGALALDVSTPGLYYGKSGTWEPASSANPTIITGITLTGTHNTFPNCTLYLYPGTINTTIKNFVLDVNQNATTAATDFYTATITIPSSYVGTHQQFCSYVPVNTSTVSISTYCQLTFTSSTISFSIYQPYTSGTTFIWSLYGQYI